MAASIPPGAKMEQAGGCNGDSALQLGAPGVSLESGPFLRIVKRGVFGITSRALNGGLEFIRFARLFPHGLHAKQLVAHPIRRISTTLRVGADVVHPVDLP